jgi:hypothetical protein
VNWRSCPRLPDAVVRWLMVSGSHLRGRHATTTATSHCASLNVTPGKPTRMITQGHHDNPVYRPGSPTRRFFEMTGSSWPGGTERPVLAACLIPGWILMTAGAGRRD